MAQGRRPRRVQGALTFGSRVPLHLAGDGTPCGAGVYQPPRDITVTNEVRGQGPSPHGQMSAASSTIPSLSVRRCRKAAA